VRQKRLGNEIKQLDLKILINSGYGLFGSPAFKYADVRVAELITAYGRHTLQMMRDIANGRYVRRQQKGRYRRSMFSVRDEAHKGKSNA
jgi:DNA polymerase elongation subunit (family B)